MKILELKIIPVSFPLQNKFKTSLGEKNVTKNVIVVLQCSDDIFGYGEASSSLAMPEASQEAMISVLKKAQRYLKNSDLKNWQELADSIYKKFNKYPTAVSAVECALLDAFCRMKKIPLSAYFGKKNVPLETYYTIPALNPKICKKILKRMSEQGFKKFKVKVTGLKPSEDFERVRLVYEYAPKSPMILDANQGWNKYSAVRFLDQVLSAGFLISLIEQPVPKQDIQGLKFIKQSIPIPIAVDESFRTLNDVKKIAEADTADVFNVKLAKTGLMEALKIVEYVKKIKKKLMIGCMMESAIGLTTSIHWACGSGIFEWVDLDSFLLLKPLNVEVGFSHKGPRIWANENLLGSGINLPAFFTRPLVRPAGSLHPRPSRAGVFKTMTIKSYKL